MIDNRRTFSIQSVIDDSEVEEIRITVFLKSDAADKVDSFVIEGAVLKWASTHIPSWVNYIRKNSMTTLN